MAFAAMLMLAPGAARADDAPPTLRDKMMTAAEAMVAAREVLVEAKVTRKLLSPAEADPNLTGMIGYEYTPMTTAPGDLQAKRTLTNPDYAAALVKLIAPLNLPPGSPVLLMMSGSSVGGNIGAIAAVEALGLSPIILASTGASMWGANNPEFNLLDILARLRERGVIHAHVEATVLGGEDAIGHGMDAASIRMLRISAQRHSIPIVEANTLAGINDGLGAYLQRALMGERPGLAISVGGSAIALGTCRESFTFPVGLSRAPIKCTDGTPGVLMRVALAGTPTLYVNNVKLLAKQWGLPFDPLPLPEPGVNAAVYGGVQ